MQVQIEHDDGTTVDYFGISDFAVVDDKISFHFHEDVDTDELNRVVSGSILGSASEAPYNEQGAREAIRNQSRKDDHKVVVGITEHSPPVTRATLSLLNNEAFDGDLTVIVE